MFKMVRLLLSILIIIHFSASTSCSLIGYYMGYSSDKSKANIEIRELFTLEQGSAINITKINGSNQFGVFARAANDSVYLENQDALAISEIIKVKLAEEPTDGRNRGLIIGAAIDVTIIALMVYNSVKGLSEAR